MRVRGAQLIAEERNRHSESRCPMTAYLPALAWLIGCASTAALICGLLSFAFMAQIIRERFQFGWRMYQFNGWTAGRMFEAMALVISGVLGIIVSAIVWRISR